LVALAARLIEGAHRPAVIAGGSVWWAHAEEELKDLVETARIPLTVNGMARGALPPGHPLFFPRARGPALGEADLIVVVGALLDFRLNFGQPPVFAEDARLVFVDVDGHRKHRAGEVSIYGDLKAALRALANAVQRGPERPEWLGKLHQAEAAARAKDAKMVGSDASPVHPARLIAEVDRFSDPDAIVVGDGGDFVSFAGRLIERPRPGLWIDPGPFGCLGSGPGYAMAAKLAHPDRQVVLLSGDGAFGFSAMEFDTMVRHRIPVVCVVGNNGIWALEKHPMQNMLGTSIAADLGHRTRYDKVVESLGGYGELVDRPDEIKPALERAFKSGVPACINVICDPEAEYPRSSVLM
jgi:acetolactate synthase-1/2/3 large subunit